MVSFVCGDTSSEAGTLCLDGSKEFATCQILQHADLLVSIGHSSYIFVLSGAEINGN